MRGLYVQGGRQRETLLKTHKEWTAYDGALIFELDTETGGCKVCVDYRSPQHAGAGGASIIFKSGTLRGDKLYACTSTEVFVFQLPKFTVCAYVSLPSFNDLHHVCPTPEGHLLAANTGLDMVMEFTGEGDVLREWNVLGEDPWARFSREIDYRQVPTTKPHRSHPNYVFHLEEEIWVTRFEQRDAVCLTAPGKRIVIGGERVHDGHLWGDSIYFTSVDGHVNVVDRKTLRVARTIDLNRIENDNREPLGWCRSLWIEDESRVWVGFGRLRHTKFMQNLNWMRRALNRLEKPTHIALYDLSAQKRLKEIDLERWGMSAIFGIFPVEPAIEASHMDEAAGQEQPVGVR